MKKIRLLIFIFIVLCLGVINVNAASATIKSNKTKVEIGDSFTISVVMKSAAAWNIHAKATGPASNCIINQADASSDANDINKTFSTVCKATGEGIVTISLSGDLTPASSGIASNISGSVKVEVVKKGTLPKTPSTPTTPTTPAKSTNNKIKELSVANYNITKINDHNYSLTVGNDVASIIVNALLEDNKAKVTGTGAHSLNVGSNKISIVVTAESGDQNTYILDVTRKDMPSIDDLNDLLKDNKNNSISLNINNVSKISSNDLNSIKNSGKIVYLNHYDDSKNVLYSWVIDGNKLDTVSDFNPNLFFTTNNESDIYKDANYAKGLILDFAHIGNLPKNIIVKINVANIFKNGVTTQLYSYDYENHKFNLNEDKLLVNNGYVELSLEHSSTYYLTQSNLNIECVTVNNIVDSSNNSSIIVIILASALTLLGLFNIWYFFIRKQKQNVGY